ncbi:MAG: hypothetical protein AB8G15_04225, partial [Saprospiraceae bacterium]
MKEKKQSTKKRQTVQKNDTSAKQRSLLLLALLIGLFGILLYSNTYTHDFALDDASAISDNYVTQKGFAGITTHLTEHYRFGYWNSSAVLYRPVSLVMFAIEWELSPDNPHIHHFGNIFLYGLTGLLLCLTLI